MTARSTRILLSCSGLVAALGASAFSAQAYRLNAYLTSDVSGSANHAFYADCQSPAFGNAFAAAQAFAIDSAGNATCSVEDFDGTTNTTTDCSGTNLQHKVAGGLANHSFFGGDVMSTLKCNTSPVAVGASNSCPFRVANMRRDDGLSCRTVSFGAQSSLSSN
jgi:hypothetical protein